MSKEKSASTEETTAAEAEQVEPSSGELTEDEMDDAVGGVGAGDDQGPQDTDDKSGNGWWNDPNS